jgi:nitrate/TMAO reductase-like tetraheme cytochrome c subunit
VSCHGNHDIRSKTDPQSRTYHLNIAATCAACHGNKQVIDKGHIAIGDVASPFRDSIHGKALSKSGLLVAPTCSDCHGAHDVRKKSDPSSKVAMANVPGTCGKCHEGIAHEFAGSVHAAVLAKGAGGPACQTCHTAHAIHAADDPAWQIGVVNQCGTCHTDKIKTYRDTFHGQVTALGYSRMATCASCHGAHEVLPASNPASRVSKQNRLKTCQTCHAGASANFASFDPHASRHDKTRDPLYYWAAKFMELLLFGVFAFFGIHTVFWLYREVREKLKSGKERH